MKARERLERIRAHGAELILTDPADGYDYAITTCHRLAAGIEGLKPLDQPGNIGLPLLDESLVDSRLQVTLDDAGERYISADMRDVAKPPPLRLKGGLY